MIEDFDVIVSSFRSEYGVAVYSDEFKKMKWNEFESLLSGLNIDSPLGRLVQIRTETDSKVIKNFSSHQRRIYNEWQMRRLRNSSPQANENAIEQMRQAFVQMALGGG
ncbi:MAG: Gp15 family bacteriophage protein [Acutalibacteraceae bacterium]|nr:Gp15 family bacteriophage protein [Acutalibacteraceae bacterium]